jgi:hypothetical protein
MASITMAPSITMANEKTVLVNSMRAVSEAMYKDLNK